MNQINYIYFDKLCNQCTRNEIEHDNIRQFSSKITKSSCPHFEAIFLRSYDKIFRVKVVFVCKKCSNVKTNDLDLGTFLLNGDLKVDSLVSFSCCRSNITVTAYLTKSSLGAHPNLPEDILNDNGPNINEIRVPQPRAFSNQNNSRPINIFNINVRNNNNPVRILPRNNIISAPIVEENISDIELSNSEKEAFKQENIMDFNQKNKILYFLDDKSKKSYKIYTINELKIEKVIEDLENQYPELNLKNRKMKVGNTELNPSYRINTYNLDENNIILIQ